MLAMKAPAAAAPEKDASYFARALKAGREHLPMRPSLPFLLAPITAFWAAICMGEELAWEASAGVGPAIDLASGIGIDGGATHLVAAALAFSIALALAAAARRSPRMGAVPAAIAAAVALGLLAGCLCWGSAERSSEALEEAGGPYRLVVTSDCMAGSYGSYSEGELSSEGGGGPAVRVRVRWGDEADALPIGASCTARGAFSRYAPDERNRRYHRGLVAGTFKPASIDGVGWAPSLQGLFGSVRLRCVELAEAAADLLGEGSPGHGEAILRGVVLGDRTGISGTELDESFKLAGLAHLLAVSGSHMSTVAALVAWLLGRLGFSRRASVIVLSTLIVCYLVLSAMQPSAFRACIMAVAAAFSFFAGRRASSISALTIAVGAMLVIDPSNAFSIGFALSVLGVAGICIFMPLASHWLERALPRRMGGLSQPLALTLTAQAATSPVSVSAFSMVPLLGPVSNMIAAPAIAFLLAAGLVAFMLSLVFSPAGIVLLAALCVAGDVVGQLVIWASAIPYAAIPAALELAPALAIAFVAAMLLWVFWPLPSARTIRVAALAGLAMVLAVSIWLSVPVGTSVVMMDVGQGDAILVRSNGRQILIDTGQYDTTLRAALGRNHVYHLDAVVLTHFDADHCGALGAMRSMVMVDKVIVAQGACDLAEEDSSARDVVEMAVRVTGSPDGVTELAAGSTLALSDELSLEMVWPSYTVSSAGNADSLCLLARYDADVDGVPEFQMLFTGDAEKEELAKMIERGLGDIDVLKVGHHGSAVTADDATLSVIRPEVALISVGAGNRYGHPAQQALDALERCGAAVFRTDLDGDITVAFDSGSLSVSCATM